MPPYPLDSTNEPSWQSIRFEKDTRYYTIRLEQAYVHFKKICTIRQKSHYQIIEQNNRPFSSQKNNKTNQSLNPSFYQKEKNKIKLDEYFYMEKAQKSFLNQLFDI